MESGQQSVRDLISIIFLRKWTIVTVFTGVVGAAAWLSFYLLSPTYETESSVLINTGQLVIPVTEGAVASESEKLASFHTQKDLITSAHIAAMTVDKLKLHERRAIGRVESLQAALRSERARLTAMFGAPSEDKPADARALAIRVLTENLSVETRPESQVLKITYRAKDPVEAAETLSTVLELYADDFNARVRSRASGMTDYLEAQLQSVQEKVTRAEQQMLAIRRGDPASGKGMRAQAMLDTPEPSGARLVGVTETPPAQTALKSHVLVMEEELRRLRARYTDAWPAVIELREQIARFTDALNEVPRRELALSRVKREMEVNQDALLFIRKNLERARIVANGNTDKINVITVVDAPRVNADPISPKKPLIMTVALLFGMAFAVVLALVRDVLDHTLRSAHDLQRHLGLKPLGSLAKF
jgi:uncharacterized protein involved in exopolysaccharide biosynthesis